MGSITVNAVFIAGEDGFNTVSSPDPLQEGYIHGGSASDPTNPELWLDSSSGTDYGHGERYEREETYGMARVRSQNRLKN